jgi:hypothetical protein
MTTAGAARMTASGAVEISTQQDLAALGGRFKPAAYANMLLRSRRSVYKGERSRNRNVGIAIDHQWRLATPV